MICRKKETSKKLNVLKMIVLNMKLTPQHSNEEYCLELCKFIQLCGN